MLFQIKNECLTVSISEVGAEMHKIIHNGIDRLWEGDPDVWDKHAPNLFPIIGRLINAEYIYDGQIIPIPTHGFCRNRPFDVELVSPSCIRFHTGEDYRTEMIYPFQFKLTIEYKLEGNKIIKKHIIENCSDKPMPFEIGGHDAYAINLGEGETVADYYIEFEGTDRLEYWGMDENGIMTLPKSVVELEDGKLTKTPEQLNIDTIILDDLPFRKAVLGCTKNDKKVIINFDDFPYLGIWTKPLGDNTRYICIEPWSALPDAHVFDRELAKKPGAITLAPGEVKELVYTEEFI